MDFIFDQFVELKTRNGSVYVAMSNIISVEPVEVDKCNVGFATGGYLLEVEMPALVLVQKIAQRRQEAQRLLRVAVK